MFKNILTDIGGIGIYGIISLVLFFSVFVGMLWFVTSMRRNHSEHMSQLPLDQD